MGGDEGHAYPGADDDLVFTAERRGFVRESMPGLVLTGGIVRAGRPVGDGRPGSTPLNNKLRL